MSVFHATQGPTLLLVFLVIVLVIEISPTIIIIIFYNQDLLSKNVLSIVPASKAVSSHTAINRWSDGLTVLAWIEIVAILVHYQPSCNTSHTMKVHYETH